MVRVAEHCSVVRPEWIDANGHMNLAYYVLVFDQGTDAWLALADLGEAHRSEGSTVFAVETHTLYRRELGLGEQITTQTRLIDADAKRLHLAHEMTSRGTVAALQEALFVNIALSTRRVAPFGAGVARRLRTLALADGEQRPPWLGGRIGLPLASH